MVENKKENIWNIPNSLTILRVIIAFITIYFILSGFDIRIIAIFFIIGMITDALDGFIARKFNQKTEFGRKADMISDRFLMIGVLIAFLIKFNGTGLLNKNTVLQMFLIITREIITFPFAIIMFASGKDIPKPKTLAKLTTVMQAISFPAIILSIYYPFFSFSIYFAILTAITGAISAFQFIKYVLVKEK